MKYRIAVLALAAAKFARDDLCTVEAMAVLPEEQRPMQVVIIEPLCRDVDFRAHKSSMASNGHPKSFRK